LTNFTWYSVYGIKFVCMQEIFQQN